MRPPCELVQKEYLPIVRARLSQRLSKQNMSQMEIAKVLSITQASVSKYLKEEPRTTLPLQLIDGLVDRLEDMITNRIGTASHLIYELCRQCIEMRIGGPLCMAHQENIKELGREHCYICTTLYEGRPAELGHRGELLNDMNRALDILLASEGFGHLIPQVRANLVACHADAETIGDVLGVPGRIFLLNDRVTIHMGPQFGASRHTASLLLWAKKTFGKVRACVCIRGDDKVVKLAKKNGFSVIELNEASAEAQDIIDAAMTVLIRKRRYKELMALHVPGGIGIEPILYLFGPSATRLAELCNKMGMKI